MPEGFEQGGGRSPEKDEQYRKNKGEFLTSVANPDEFQKDTKSGRLGWTLG